MMRPRLLVSVRDAEEALAAASGGAAIIDIKEPLRGSLGRADEGVVRAILRTLQDAGHIGSISAALGELCDLPRLSELATFDAGLHWVKAGLSRCQEIEWRPAWRQLAKQLQSGGSPCRLIAVAYADWSDCGAPPPHEVVQFALESGSPGVLFDTFHKDGRSLLDHLSPWELRNWIAELRAAGRFAALAGAVDRQQLPNFVGLAPDIIAVRTAACAGGRLGRVDAGRVFALRASLKSASACRQADLGSPQDALADDE
jgi:uncharacterized protein (UPF0264 family)